MKTKFFSMLMIAAAIASCSKEKVVNNGANDSAFNKIAFSAYSSLNNAKGIPVDNDNFKTADNTFSVNGFINISDVSDAYLDAVIKYDGTTSKWVYNDSNDTQYWPSDATQTINFYAHANEGTNTVTTTKAGGMSVDTYTVPTTITDQKDFMYAAVPNVENIDDTDGNVDDNGAVSLNFRHALTQINFTAQVADGLTLEVQSIEVCNVKSAGKFTVAANANTNATEGDECAWASHATPATYTVANTTTPVKITTATATAINDSNAGHELMLLPQTFTAWDGTSKASEQTGAYILLTCKLYKAIKTDNGASETTADVYYIGDANTMGKTAIPFASIVSDTDVNNPEWVSGRNITYNFAFSADPTTPGGGKDPETGESTLIPITFTPNVTAWENYTGNGNLNM